MLTDGRTDDGRTTDAGVTGILIAHLGAFGSGELKRDKATITTQQYIKHNTVAKETSGKPLWA